MWFILTEIITVRHIFKGAIEREPKTWKKIEFKNHLNRKIYVALLTPTTRQIEFDFTLEMHPDWGEIHLKGKRILESPDQRKIALSLAHKVHPVEKLINDIIIKVCLHECRKMCLKEQIPFPSVQLLLGSRKRPK
jgi:hypothetical protein